MILLLTSLLLSTLAMCLSHWLGRRNPGKSSTLTGGMIVLLLLLPFTLFLPKLKMSMAWLQTEMAASPLTADSSSWNLNHLILGLWALGSGILFIRLARHYWAVRTWRRTSERCTTPLWTHRLHESCSLLNMDSIPTLGICDHITSPVVTGLVYPQILLPRSSENWSEETMNHVLLHELGHVKRRDLWVSIASHLTCAVHWFNPLVWKLRKQQAAQCEFACDAYVLASGANPKSYIHALCDVAEDATNTQPVALALAMANKASLRQRVEILLEGQKPSGRWLTALILIGTSSLAIAINVIQPQPSRLPKKIDPTPTLYPPEEVQKRLEADPFPGN